jgi:hypothetical protein
MRHYDAGRLCIFRYAGSSVALANFLALKSGEIMAKHAQPQHRYFDGVRATALYGKSIL